MKSYTKNITINVTEIQFNTLEKIRLNNIKVGNFIREAIQEKIKREYQELILKNKKSECPF
jgi:hypothetical protein